MLGRLQISRVTRLSQVSSAIMQRRVLTRAFVPTRYDCGTVTPEEAAHRVRRIESIISKISDDKRHQQHLLAMIDRPFMTASDYLIIDDQFRESSVIPDFISEHPNEGEWLATSATHEVVAILINELARQACSVDQSLTEDIAVKMLLDSAQHFEAMSTSQRENLEHVCQKSARMSLNELRALIHELNVASHFRDQQANPAHSHLRAAVPIFNRRSLNEIVQLVQHHSQQHPKAPIIVRQLAWILYERAIQLYGVATTHELCLTNSHNVKNAKFDQHDGDMVNRLNLGTLVQLVAQHDREARAAHAEAARRDKAVNEYSSRSFYE